MGKSKGEFSLIILGLKPLVGGSLSPCPVTPIYSVLSQGSSLDAMRHCFVELMATGSAVRNFPPSLNPPPLKLCPSVCELSAPITISGVSCGFQVSHFELRHGSTSAASEQQGRACCFEVCGQKEGNPLLAPDRVRENGETNEQELASIELMMRCLLEK